jgi:hypothetical protein
VDTTNDGSRCGPRFSPSWQRSAWGRCVWSPLPGAGRHCSDPRPPWGLDFSPTDPFGLIDHRFDLFGGADGARCENVLWGHWHGVEVKAGELRFKTGLTNQNVDSKASSRRYSFAVVHLEAWVPHLVIRHDPLAALSEDLLLERLRFESEAFNRTYRVKCDEQHFAYASVDPRMMLRLLGLAEGFRFDFEVRGDRGLVSCPC